MSEEKHPAEPTSIEEAIELISIALEPIPFGGILSSAAVQFIRKRQNQRLYKSLIDLANDLNSLQDQVNQEFMRTEEFKDLFEDIFNKVSDSRHQEKIDSYRAIFVNTVISDTPDYDEAAEIASQIERWQPRHIVLLKILADPRRADEEMGNPVGNGEGTLTTSFNQILSKLLPDLDSDQIDRTMLDLYDARIQRVSSTGGTLSGRGIRHLEGLLTSFGQKVVRYLTNPAED